MCINSNQEKSGTSEYDVIMKPFVLFAIGTVLILPGTPLTARNANASGFTLTDPCGKPPFRSGQTDMHLHLTRFPKQKRGQELVLDKPSVLGSSGVTDWIKVRGELCGISNPSACTEAESARVQVLNYSSRYYPIFRDWFTSPHISGSFEVSLKDGTVIESSFSAKARKVKYSRQPICE
jgi:hypothetical protein